MRFFVGDRWALEGNQIFCDSFSWLMISTIGRAESREKAQTKPIMMAWESHQFLAFNHSIKDPTPRGSLHHYLLLTPNPQQA
jgi:hypothetical protein